MNRIRVRVLLVTTWVVVVCCVNNAQLFAASQPLFVDKPAIELDPNLNTPLAALLTLSTDIPTRVSVSISNERDKWQIDFKRLELQHALPILGLIPDSTYTITVHAKSKSGSEAIFKPDLSVTTDPLPKGFPTISAVGQANKMEPGYTLFDVVPEGNNAEFGALLIIVDAQGEVVWYQIGSRYLDVRQNAAGNLLYLQGNSAIEMDMLGNIIHEWRAAGNEKTKKGDGKVAAYVFHHELFPMVNGHYLAMSAELRAFENYPSSETDITAVKASAYVVGDVIVEFAADGTTLKHWSLLDMLDPYRIGYGSLGPLWDDVYTGYKTRDWSHGNAVTHDPTDDSILVMLRHQDALVKFKRQSGQLIWILGPHENWQLEKWGKYLLTPKSLGQHKYFFAYHAHAHMVLPNGHILLYDNGNERASAFNPPVESSKNFSRAVEYVINEQTMEVDIAWEYGEHAQKQYFSSALGDADLLPRTGNVLITHGTLMDQKGKQSARVIEVTHTTPANEVFNLSVTDLSNDPKNGWRVYRSERIPSLYTQKMD